MKHLSHKAHKRNSPNLYSWLRKHGGIEKNQVWSHKVTGKAVLIGWLERGGDFDGWFHGCGLMQVLCNGSAAEPSCMRKWFDGSIIAKDFEPIENFWEEYARIGRCAIDKDHEHHFINAETRWAYDATGKQRSCQWCMDHTQVEEEWEEVVQRKGWKTVQPLNIDLAKQD